MNNVSTVSNIRADTASPFDRPGSPGDATSSTCSIQSLGPTQESRLVVYLDDRFIEMMGGYRKRQVADPTGSFHTLADYVSYARELLHLILKIPPAQPSASLRIAYFLQLIGDVLESLVGYPVHASDIQRVLDWLVELDEASVVILRGQPWDPPTREGISDSPPPQYAVTSQTDRTRLCSIIISGSASIGDWIEQADVNDDTQSFFDDLPSIQKLFPKTLDELSGLEGVNSDPE
ncbi:hypothetical protein FISHEDRAFT_47809 [Fistulina hepatica ATCC 64428]|uniref:Uncharacterized protein n=1 Tax=Fistulina hepatica ATCC 64428 TaxID=1128425 RepID=A0A0D7A5F8_9AGAR|nr:hypothetical protein FISHEDRAFT_47809 [Fistulina hepatica ATCC 64428]